MLRKLERDMAAAFMPEYRAAVIAQYPRLAAARKATHVVATCVFGASMVAIFGAPVAFAFFSMPMLTAAFCIAGGIGALLTVVSPLAGISDGIKNKLERRAAKALRADIRSGTLLERYKNQLAETPAQAPAKKVTLETVASFTADSLKAAFNKAGFNRTLGQRIAAVFKKRPPAL